MDISLKQYAVSEMDNRDPNTTELNMCDLGTTSPTVVAQVTVDPVELFQNMIENQAGKQSVQIQVINNEIQVTFWVMYEQDVPYETARIVLPNNPVEVSQS